MRRGRLGRNVGKLGSVVGHFDASVGAAHPAFQVCQAAQAIQSRVASCNLRWVNIKALILKLFLIVFETVYSI